MVLAAIGIGFFIGRSGTAAPAEEFAAGTTVSPSDSKPIENYVPAIKYNGGYFSNLPILASSTLAVTGQLKTYATTTQSALVGNCAYQRMGPLGSEADYAFCTVPSTSTSSIPFIQPNPFGTATSSLLVNQSGLRVTNGLAGANVASLSTTTGASGYGSSTPAIALDFSLPSSGQVYVEFMGNTGTVTSTTSPAINGSEAGVLPGRTPEGLSNYIIGSNVFTNVRIATSSPGTFSTAIAGKLFLVFKKL